MLTFEYGNPHLKKNVPLWSDGVPTFLGRPAARSPKDLHGSDVAIVGVPYVSPWVGFDNQLSPRNIRIASVRYRGGYLPELDVDVFEHLKVVDYGDARIEDDVKASMSNVARKVEEVLDAGAIPVSIGGNAPCASYAVIEPIVRHSTGKLGVVNLDCHGDNLDGVGDEPNSSNWVKVMIDRKLVPSGNMAHIGLRGPANVKARTHWFSEQGIHLYTARQVRLMGAAGLTREVARVLRGTDGVWFAIDFDVLDILNTPDWIHPDPLGVLASDICELAFEVGKHKLAGVSMMMIPGHGISVHLIVIWTILYALAGKAVAKQSGSSKVRRKQ